jgi:hypothetical protein
MNRSIVPPCLIVAALLTASCSSTEDSDVLVPGADATVAADDTGPVASDPASAPATDAPAVDPPVTEAPADTPPATDRPAPATTAPAPALAGPTAATTVVYAGNDFGGAWPALATWNGSAWQPADFDAAGNALVAPASDFTGVSVASLGLAEPISGLAYGAEDFVCVDDRMGPTIVLPAVVGDIPASSGYNAVAVATDWNVQPRDVDQVGLDVAEYQTIGESIAAAAGVDGSSGDVVQAVRADLDGDGVEEVLVTFQKITEGFGTPGDFSIVFARYPTAAGDVVDDVLFEYYPEPSTDFPTLGSAGLLAVADLNGDAVMEVVLRSTFWESASVELFSFTGGALQSVAGTGCGV